MSIFGVRVELILLVFTVSVSIFATILRTIGYVIEKYIVNYEGDEHGLLH